MQRKRRLQQKTDYNAMLERVGKSLQEFAGFIISPWIHGASVKPLQKRVDLLEKLVYERLPNTEQRLETIIEHLQNQINLLQNHTKHRIDKLVEYDLRQQVLDVLKEQTNLIGQSIQPTIEDLMRELEYKKQRLKDNSNVDAIQVRQQKLRESLMQIQQLTALLPHLEARTAACLEAGHWLLTHRQKLAQEIVYEVLSPQHPQSEVFYRNICKYLKLLGACMENGIEPRLLYQGIITHQQPSVEIYLRAFQLIRTKYITNWESLNLISNKAAEELRGYFNYLIDYLLKVLL